MRWLNQLLGSIFDVLMLPFAALPAIVGVVVWSAIAGVLALIAYKYTSNQEAIAAVKAKITASFFEIRLFNDDLRALLRAQGDLLRNNLRYMGLNLVPLLYMIVPFGLLVAQLQFFWGYHQAKTGQDTLVIARLSSEAAHRLAPRKPDITLELPDGVALAGPSVWSAELREMAWKITPKEAGDFELAVAYDGTRETKKLAVRADGERWTRRAPLRPGTSLLDQFLYPSEPPLDGSSPFERLSVRYDDAEIDVGLFSAHWLVPFLLFSVVFAFVLKDRLGVTL